MFTVFLYLFLYSFLWIKKHNVRDRTSHNKIKNEDERAHNSEKLQILNMVETPNIKNIQNVMHQ